MRFSTVDDVHGSLGRLLQELAIDPQVGARLTLLDTIVQFRLRRPDTTLTLAVRAHEPPSVQLGELPEGAAAPDVVLTLDADVAHALWLGQQNVAIGIARGAIQTKGDVRKIVDLLNLTDQVVPRYTQMLRAIGREDLLAPPAPAPETGPPAAGEPDAPVPDPDAPTPGADDAPPADSDAPVPDPDAPVPAGAPTPAPGEAPVPDPDAPSPDASPADADAPTPDPDAPRTPAAE